MKLIAIDLDGTLLNNQGCLSTKTIEVITQIRNEGHKVVIATGRHLNSALPIAEQLSLSDAVVCFNGALVLNLENKSPEISLSYVNNDIYNLTRLIKTWGYEYFAATQNDYHIESSYRSLIENFSKKGIPIDEVNDILEVKSPILKTSIIGGIQELDRIEKYIPHTVPGLHVVRSGEESIDVMSPHATKGAALKWLANYYKIEQIDTISFGNYDNDITMLQYAGIGIAMDNAPDHVKKHADIITLSNEEDGVARFLEENVLRKMTISMY